METIVVKALIAPDKFKGSLTAAQVAEAVAAGMLTVPGVEVSCLPLADGGDGSVEAAISAGFRRIPVDTVGPTGLPRTADIAFDGTTAVVEVAGTCGIALLPGGALAPLTSSSTGFGVAVAAALGLHPARLVLALGGSASTDGGLGLLVALGARAYDAAGRPLTGSGADLLALTSYGASGLPSLAGIELVVATDVDSPLAGPAGAAHVFGPQKGADPATVERLDAALGRFAALADASGTLARQPGAGAAGGLGFAALLLGGHTVSGAEYFLDLLDFDTRVRDADLVITGEGRLDDQTLAGKLPSVVAHRSTPRPVHVVTGRDDATDRDGITRLFAGVHELASRTTLDTRNDPELTARLLRDIGVDIGAHIAAAQR